jgi:hypothetical protein
MPQAKFGWKKISVEWSGRGYVRLGNKLVQAFFAEKKEKQNIKYLCQSSPSQNEL